jgi:putative endonuclease
MRRGPLHGWHVYIVRCADGTLYTGVARDVRRRVEEHNGAGGRGAKYTRGRRPVRLAYAKKARSRSDAQRKEARLKRLPKAGKEALVRLSSTESLPKTRLKK